MMLTRKICLIYRKNNKCCKISLANISIGGITIEDIEEAIKITLYLSVLTIIG
jgi:hypothetical protein